MTVEDVAESFEYKATEIGFLPKTWNVSKLKELLLLNDSGIWGENCEGKDECTEVLRSTNIQNNKWVLDDIALRKITKRDLERYLLKEGDILLVKSSGSKDHIGKCAYVDEKIEKRRAVFANFMQRLRFRSEVHPHYAFYYMLNNGRRELLNASTTTTGLRNLKKTDFENVIMPIPSYPEQQKIAFVLSRIRAAQEKSENTLHSLAELRKLLMKHLFIFGATSLENAVRVQLKETEIGMIPEEWSIVKLGDVASITYGIQAAVAHLNDRSQGIPILTNINIKNDGFLDLSVLRYYNLHSSKKDKLLLKGDILFNWRSGSKSHVGKTAIFDLDGEYTFSSFILRFRTNEKIDNSYLFFNLNFLKNNGFFSAKGNVSSVNAVFNASYSANIPIYLPPLPEQKKIASILSSVDTEIEAEERRKKSLDELFKSMLITLMSAKIRVNTLGG